MILNVYDNDIVDNDDNDNDDSKYEWNINNESPNKKFLDLERGIIRPSDIVSLNVYELCSLAKLRISLPIYLKLIVEFHQYSQIRL